jgi:hypothetical protein
MAGEIAVGIQQQDLRIGDFGSVRQAQHLLAHLRGKMALHLPRVTKQQQVRYMALEDDTADPVPDLLL